MQYRIDMPQRLSTAISRFVWETRYRAPGESSIQDTWRRVAHAVAAVEPRPDRWGSAFLDALEGFRFLPAGRILAGAGTPRPVTLFNCFVMGVLPPELGGILDALKEGALTMQQGGGVGYDFSTLPPAGTPDALTGGVAAGPVAYMRLWDSMCATVTSTGARRGAMMATLRCDHPDVEAFVDAKADPRELRRFNVSVQVSDALMEAVRQDAPWPLVFPDPDAGGEAAVLRRWTGSPGPVPCRIVRTVRARALWDRILRATYAYAEPGVLFVDRIAAADNLAYTHHLTATNPCGEIPLQPYGACDLGSIDLVSFVRDPLTPRAHVDFEGLQELVPVAVRFLDDVIDVSGYPLEAQRREALATRRIGLGFTGLGDALILLGLHYDSPEARELAERVMRTIAVSAYRASVALAEEKGPFPILDVERHLERPFVRSMPADVREGIAMHGIRNSHLLAVAPTGTISLLADNVSSGIEPVFDWRFERSVVGADGTRRPYTLEAWSWRSWQERGGGPLPPSFVRSEEVSPRGQLEMQAVVQRWVDNAVSKTIIVPEQMSFEDFRGVYDGAWELGLKGCTTWRPNPVTGTVLSPAEACRNGCEAGDRSDEV